MASVLSLLKIEIPYPVLLYLKFDLAELPSLCALLLLGPSSGAAVATVHFLFLAARAWPPGAFMKYIAVLSTLFGVWLGSKLGRSSRLIACAALGIVCRVAAMALANLLFFTLLFPEYLEFAETLLRAGGIDCRSPLEALLWTSVLTALFNALHVLLDLVPSYALLRSLSRILSPRLRSSFELPPQRSGE